VRVAAAGIGPRDALAKADVGIRRRGLDTGGNDEGDRRTRLRNGRMTLVERPEPQAAITTSSFRFMRRDSPGMS
jgi:hypothetical protein